MGWINRVAAKADQIQGEIDEKRGHKHDDGFLIAEGKVKQDKARDRREADRDESDSASS